MTAAERAAWAAAGAAATIAALAGMAVAWGRAVERNEAYGTWQEQGGGRISGPGTRDGDVPALLSRGGPVCGFDNVPLRRVPGPVCELPGCVLHETPAGND